jgi:hypothetical protein
MLSLPARMPRAGRRRNLASSNLYSGNVPCRATLIPNLGGGKAISSGMAYLTTRAVGSGGCLIDRGTRTHETPAMVDLPFRHTDAGRIHRACRPTQSFPFAPRAIHDEVSADPNRRAADDDTADPAAPAMSTSRRSDRVPRLRAWARSRRTVVAAHLVAGAAATPVSRSSPCRASGRTDSRQSGDARIRSAWRVGA